MSTADPLPEADCAEGAEHPRLTTRLFGHESAESDFVRAVQSDRLHHAWLITGPKGIGKATLAWRAARYLLAGDFAKDTLDLPESDPARPKNERKLRKLVEPIGGKLVMPCDVQKEEDIDAVFDAAKEQIGPLDFVVHSIAFATIEDLKGPVYNCSRDGFKLAMDISAFSLIALARRAKDALVPGGGGAAGDREPLGVHAGEQPGVCAL